MYHASIKKHARIRHLAREGASRNFQSMYRSLINRGSIKRFTPASQSLPVPDDMAIDKDALINTNISACGLLGALPENKMGNLSNTSTSTEIDSDAAANHSDNVHKLSSNTTFSDDPDTLSDTSTSTKYDADAESESDIASVDLDKIASLLWIEGEGFWVHDFKLVRQFEKEKRIADMTGGGAECFTAEPMKDEEEDISEGISEEMKTWIEFKFSAKRKGNLKKDYEEELAKEGGVRELSDM